jgi:hypothetical protein
MKQVSGYLTMLYKIPEVHIVKIRCSKNLKICIV